ncbi:MAG: hypothetical protein C5B46_02270 [Proteobacteria bacterium]|nr:MAG: hypothetical protein C5B46_02270 [Pseudomonadota bacterium]
MNELDFQLLEDHTALDSIGLRGHEVRKGDRVVLRPKSGGDILDLALNGKSATVESIEQDYESRIHIAVVIDDDPGKELGMMRQPGHRFFFSPEEVEPL